MKRIALILIIAPVFLAVAFAAEAQPPARHPRVGVLAFGVAGADPAVNAFRQGLREVGYVEGQNILIEFRYAEGRAERLPELATDLARQEVHLIFALGTDVAAAAKQATSVIPIVAVGSGDLVKAGLVASLARPGGNVTGLTFLSDELAGKRLELLKEARPGLSRVAILWDPRHPDSDFGQAQVAAGTMGIRLQSFKVRTADDVAGAIRTAAQEGGEALFVVPSRLTFMHRRRIAEVALEHRLPTIGHWREFALAGGLVTYGPNITELIRRSVVFVDRILKGAKPADLPVEQPTKFELVINLKTARALGLTIPPAVLLRADEVIE